MNKNFMISVDYILGVLNGALTVINYSEGSNVFLLNIFTAFILLIAILLVSEGEI